MGQVLAILALVAIWAVFVYCSPTKRCRCAGRCGRCKGTGRRFRLGARLVCRGIVKGRDEARRTRPRA